LVVTRGPNKPRQNLGIYRQQVIAPNKVIMRWLAHRGGALDFRDHAIKHPGQAFPIAVALGADPATILGAVTPVPDTLSEYQFAGLLRGGRTEVVQCLGSDLQVPASAEVVISEFMADNSRTLADQDGDYSDWIELHNAKDLVHWEQFPADHVYYIPLSCMTPKDADNSTCRWRKLPPTGSRPTVMNCSLNGPVGSVGAGKVALSPVPFFKRKWPA
jgi:hypothetical protein